MNYKGGLPGFVRVVDEHTLVLGLRGALAVHPGEHTRTPEAGLAVRGVAGEQCVVHGERLLLLLVPGEGEREAESRAARVLRRRRVLERLAVERDRLAEALVPGELVGELGEPLGAAVRRELDRAAEGGDRGLVPVDAGGLAGALHDLLGRPGLRAHGARHGDGPREQQEAQQRASVRPHAPSSAPRSRAVISRRVTTQSVRFIRWS